jgi:hypothetical protein
MLGEDAPFEFSEEPFKIGTHVRGEGIVEFRYENTFQRQMTEERERLVIAPSNDHIEVILRLIREMTPPYWVLYILMVPHHDSSRAGRYQLGGSWDDDASRELLTSFKDFFEGDARHHLWIGSNSDRSMVVYDQHNVIFAYGPVDQFAAILQAQGLQEGPVNYPYPHTHHFRSAFDHFEQELLTHYSATWYPLEDGDED